MDRMKTLLLYALGIIGFMFLSYLLEGGLIDAMYEKIDGDIIPGYNINITDVSGRATNVNGNMKFRLTNDSANLENLYVKIDLYSKQDLLAVTRYLPITDLPVGSSKEYQVSFKGNGIRRYEISIVNNAPDKTNILNILGWEIDLTNVLGMDLSDTTIFGVKLTEIFSWDSAKTAAGNMLDWTVNLLESVPWWGYAIATGIIIWYI